MKPCKDMHDEIIFYDDLSPGEQQAVDEHIESCADCRKYFSEMQAIMIGLQENVSTTHINDSLLTRHGMYLSDSKEPDYDGRRLTRREFAKIEKHLQACRSCKKKVEEISREFRDIDTYLEKAGVPDLRFAKESLWSKIHSLVGRSWQNSRNFAENMISLPKLQPLPAAVGAFATMLVLVWISPLFRGSEYQYYKLASIEIQNENVGALVRGDAAELLSEGLYAFDQGKYQIAVEKLEKGTTENLEDVNLVYAHYVSGIACLALAKSDFLGRFHRIDAGLVNRAVVHLQIVIRTNNNLRIQENAYWFIGKAYLMLQNFNEAKEAFEEAVALNGSKANDANQLLVEIQRVLSQN